MSCQDGCHPVNIASCEDEIIVTGLEVNQPYYYLLINKYQKIYQRLVTTDGQGKLIIDTTILPPGSMNKFSGPFRLEFRSGTDYTNKILFSFDGISYSCIEINLLDIDIADDADSVNIIELNKG